MAKGGGGAWKVAYADFVTAMMAFFLVMWLVSQDQKIKESIAHYFQGPIGINLLGETARRSPAAGLFYSEVTGPVPGQGHWVSGRNIGTVPEAPDPQSDTMTVADYILENKEISDYWMSFAQLAYDKARKENPDVRDQSYFDKIVKHEVTWEMHHQLSQPVVDKMQGVHRELLLNALTNIDWNAIADELLLRVKKRDISAGQ